MKVLSLETNKFVDRSSPFISKNLSNANMNIYSPIKVRKKLFGLSKINSKEWFKVLRLSNPLNIKDKKDKHKSINISIKKIIAKNLDKYNSFPEYYYRKITNQIIFNLPHHLISNFKDFLIWDANFDYIKNYYILNKSKELLPKIGNYYETYTLFIPIYFSLMDIKDIISKYIINKKKFLEMTEENDNLTDEIKDMDKNVIGNTNSNNNNNKYNENKELLSKESNKEKIEKKLITSSEIRSEKSQSISNYFGIDSIIKSKENHYPTNNDLIYNYVELPQIKNKKNIENNKELLDFSLELASIIQSIEENRKNKENFNNIKTSNYNSNKTLNNNNKKEIFIRIDKYDLKDKINLNRESNHNSLKTSKNTSTSIKDKHKHKFSIFKSKNKYKNIILSSTNLPMNYILKNNKLGKYNFLLKKKSSFSFKTKKYIQMTDNNYNNYNKSQVKHENNNNNSYKSFAFLMNKTPCFLYKNKKRSFSTKEKCINIISSKKILYKKLNNLSKLKSKSKESRRYSKIIKGKRNMNFSNENSSQTKNKKSSLSINISQNNNLSKTREYSMIYASPSLNFRNSVKYNRNKRNRSNNQISLSHSKSNNLKRNYSLKYKKLIFVNKRRESNNIKFDKKHEKLINNTNKSFNILNTSNKISVNKIDILRKSAKYEQKLTTPKNKRKISVLNLNNIGPKVSLIKCKPSYLETEYNNFIPKSIIRKMFYNNFKNGGLTKNIINKKSPMKQNFSSKNNLYKYANRIQNDSKTNKDIIYNNKLNVTFIPEYHSKNKQKMNNRRMMTEVDISKKTINKINLPKEKNKNNDNHITKISLFKLNNTRNYKNKNNLFKHNNNNNNNNKYNNFNKKTHNNKFNKTTQEIIKDKSIINNPNIKKSFADKNNFMINVNIYNNIKLNQENLYDKKNIKNKNNKLFYNIIKTPFINKNKIHDLIKISIKKDKRYQTNTNKITSKKKNLLKNSNLDSNDLPVKSQREEKTEYFLIK